MSIQASVASFNITDEDQMVKLAEQLSKRLKKGIVFLDGDLGSGKTTLVRAWLQACGVSRRIKSPTYSIVESYEVDKRQFHHFDLYRINHPQELEEIGIRDYFNDIKNGEVLTLIFMEWPYKVETDLPTPDLVIQYQNLPNESGRMVSLLTADADLQQELLQKLEI